MKNAGGGAHSSGGGASSSGGSVREGTAPVQTGDPFRYAGAISLLVIGLRMVLWTRRHNPR